MRNSVIYIAAFLFLSIFASSTAAWPMLVTDNNNIPFYEEIIELHYPVNGTSAIKYLSTNSSGYLNIDLDEKIDKLDFILREGGPIYYGSAIPSAEKVKLKPIAKITAFVIDDKDNYLKGVGLKIICNQPISSMPLKTNEIGYFEVSEVGLGECSISMIKGQLVKTYQLNISESKEYALRILFPEQKIGITSSNLLTILFLIVVLALLIIAFLIRKIVLAKKKLDTYKSYDKIVNPRSNSDDNLILEESSETDIDIGKSATVDLSMRQKDIMKTLSENENKIIIFLLKHDCHATQSQIRYDTGLPKATLHRHISKLQNKGIASVQEYGKLKKVLLTEFFLKK